MLILSAKTVPIRPAVPLALMISPYGAREVSTRVAASVGLPLKRALPPVMMMMQRLVAARRVAGAQGALVRRAGGR